MRHVFLFCNRVALIEARILTLIATLLGALRVLVQRDEKVDFGLGSRVQEMSWRNRCSKWLTGFGQNPKHKPPKP